MFVTADLATFFQIWLGRVRREDALYDGRVDIDAIPALEQAFPNWFTYSRAAPVVRMTQTQR